jgi:hypothetical protein
MHITEYLASKGAIHCLQLNLSDSDLEQQILMANSFQVESWIYRPFSKGEIIRKSNKKPEKIMTELCQKYPNCKFVFGASKLEQLSWLKLLQ